MDDQILRIVFKSGRIAERRGDDQTVVDLYDADLDGLIDYVMSIDLWSNDISFFTREGDHRMDEEQVITIPVPKPRE